jgi:hypothetical protein
VDPPTSVASCIPGIRRTIEPTSRELGIAAMTSLFSVCCVFALCTSTMGDSPLTVMVSSRAPTCMSPLTVATKVPLSSIPSRRAVLNPASENVTVYAPGGSATIRY